MNLAYIEKPLDEYEDDWLYACYLGCSHLGIKVINFDDIEEVPKNKLVFASISNTIKYLTLNNISIPAPLNIPSDIEKYAYRPTTTIKLSEFISSPHKHTFPLFIKPYEQLKGFVAGVLNRPSNLSLLFADVENKEQLAMITPVVSMESEYRCFVHNRKLVGIKHYHGDFTLFPNIEVIKRMINDYASAPIAYTLDVAVTDTNETILIECNDAWSIGNYGLDAEVYVKLLIDRWKQLTNDLSKYY